MLRKLTLIIWLLAPGLAYPQATPLPGSNVMISPPTGGYLNPRALVSQDLYQGGSCLVGSVFTNIAGTIGCAALNANQIVLGGGAAGPATPVGLGTTTQLLHGNASGAPNFSILSSADVTAVLASPPPIGNTAANTIAATTLAVPSLPGLSTSVSFSSPFGGPPSFGLALASNAAPWVIAATATSPATANGGGALYVSLVQNQLLVSVTISNASPAVVTLTNHGLAAGNTVSFLGTLGAPLTASASYYVCAAGLTTNTFEISTTSACASPINTSAPSSGVTMATNHGLPGADPSIFGFTNVNQGSIGNYTGVLGYVYNANTMASQPSGVASAVGTYGLGSCAVAGCSATWGGVIATYNNSGSVPTNALIGLEVDNYDNGTDPNGIKTVLQLNCGKLNSGGAANFCSNLILGGGTVGNTYLFSGSAVNGINLNAGTFSGGAFLSPGFSLSGSGSITQSPTTVFAAGVVPGINQSYAATGSVGTATSAVINAFDLSSDNLTVSGSPSNASLALLSAYDFSFGGAAMTGGRLAGDFALMQSAAPSASSAFNDYIGLHGTVSSTSGAGGATGSEKGDYYAMWGSAILHAGATSVKALQGLELDMEADTGSSVLYKAALLAGGTVNDAVQGSVVDTVFWIANSTGTVGAKNGLLFGRSDGFGGLGVSSTGTLIAVATEVATIGAGINLYGGGSLTITGNAWKSPGQTQPTIIDGLGNIKANTLNIVSGGGYSWGASLAQIALATNMYIDNLVPGDWVFRTTGSVEEFRISAAGVLSSVGVPGVTCAGSPTASFSTKNGIVTHC